MARNLEILCYVASSINAISAIVLVWILVKVTPSAGFSSAVALLQFAQRICLGILAIIMMANAVSVSELDNNSLITRPPPRMLDVIEQAVFMAVLIFGAARHSFAPMLPAWVNWKTPVVFHAQRKSDIE
jgi:hypothetical protein